jgi:sporulation and spore germination protein/immunoglobulin-like protein involved in spore germination
MKRLLPIAVLALAVAAVAAACGGGGEAVPAGEVPTVDLPATPPAEPAPPSTDPAPAETPPATETDPGGEAGQPEPKEMFTYEVWFTKGESLFVVHRTEPKVPAVATIAMGSLLEGPTASETASGIGSEIPDDTTLLGVTVENGIATVDLSAEYESGGGSLSMMMRLAQVVYTLTQFPTVQKVSLELDGQPVEVFSGEGIVLDEPVDRDDYEEMLPIILVAEPAIGARVESPVHVEGIANVFEANVTVEILDAAGNVIAQDFTTATCGTGCFGDYALDLAFDLSEEQPGTIVVHDDDAAGTGTPPHVVEIPVTLVP